MNGEELGGLVRHFLTVAGGALAAKGYLDNGSVELIAGAVATLVAVGWSIWAKRRKA